LSRYTKDQLRAMAQTVLNARSMDDSRYIELIMLLVARTQMTPAEITQEIERLAAA